MQYSFKKTSNTTLVSQKLNKLQKKDKNKIWNEKDKDEIETNILQGHKVYLCGLKYNCIHKIYRKSNKIMNNSNKEDVLKKTKETLEE